jgi:hypothetical protein
MLSRCFTLTPARCLTLARCFTPARFFTLARCLTLTLASLSAVLALALHAAPPPPDAAAPTLIPNMEATGQFFSNALAIDIRFGRMQRPGKAVRPAPDENPANPANPPPEGKSGGRRRGGGKGGPPPGGGRGGKGGPGRGGDPGDRAANMREERNPATQFHVTLTNNGAVPLVVEILDFDSALGNFAVKPDKITIASGQSAQTDPMISRLGIPTEDLPLKIRVRAGKTSEEQTLTLKILPPSQPPPDAQ